MSIQSKLYQQQYKSTSRTLHNISHNLLAKYKMLLLITNIWSLSDATIKAGQHTQPTPA